MSFNFWACSQENGIIFSYNNYQNALFVYREEGEIKEQQLTENEISIGTKVVNFVNKMIMDLIKMGSLLLLECIVVLYFKINICYVWIIYLGIFKLYKYYIIINNLMYSNTVPTSMKQYHSAEHMIFNAKLETISIKELRNYSKYVGLCSTNDDIENFCNFILIGASTNIFCSLLMSDYNLLFKIIIFVIYVILVNLIYNVVDLVRCKGLFNVFLQPLYLKEPTDSQLELAIYGYKRARELEKNDI